ncbi:MAG: cysteine--tRNA ligase [Actinobacteria bacterium]|nr:cysteine--tRNA ligase [Actinomycetota bacterium]
MYTSYPRPVRLHDGRTGELVDVETRPRMGVYVCGITPYDSAHVGHAFTYVHFDVLVRYLRRRGAEVTHVRNVTDVDDDILRVARERGVDFRELAARETEKFARDMGALGVVPPTVSPRATEFVPEMVEEVERLVAAGFAYERGGNVYFRVAADSGYGRLSGLSRQEMLRLAEERGGHPEDPEKDDPLDFVLWQRSAPDEPWWDSPWGRGRPGWHIECSTMALRLLGRPVDIHGGGDDLIYPHHECELAQAEGVPSGAPFVRHWMHTGSVAQDGTKMSKSLGNLVFVSDLLERYDGATIRSFLLRRHYRDDWEFDEGDLEAFAARSAGGLSRNSGVPAGSTGREAFFGALDRDLDAPAALDILDRAASRPEDADARRLLEEGTDMLGLHPSDRR